MLYNFKGVLNVHITSYALLNQNWYIFHNLKVWNTFKDQFVTYDFIQTTISCICTTFSSSNLKIWRHGYCTKSGTYTKVVQV